MNRQWKDNNEEYLKELQKLFDIVDNVKDEELRKRIIGQFLKCDNILTELAEDLFCIYYIKGKRDIAINGIK